MELGIQGKKALVTGGATGIGKAIVKELAKEGVKVFFTSRNEEDLNNTLNEIGGASGGHKISVCDIIEEGAPQKLGEEVLAKLGAVDIIVNNVGSTFAMNDPLVPISGWRKMFRLNLEVAIEVNNFFIPHMRKAGWGRIVNISAGSGMENNGPVPYCAAKAALTAYSRSMGRVLAAENIIMSAIMPGVVLTERGSWEKTLKERPEHAEKYLRERCPAGRFGLPGEISPMVVLLCSELATFCQGSIVPVDGGQCKHYYQVQGF